MRNAGRLIDILDRMETGPVMDEKEFDMKVVAKRTAELVKEHEIKFDGKSIVNTDDAMADRCFEAGLQLAADAGLYCTSNNRRLLWTRDEIVETIKWAPKSVLLGAGRDAHTVYRRSPEDTTRPTVIGGPIGQTLPEDLFMPIMQSYAQEPIVDTVVTGTLATVYGRDPRTKSPWEILVGWHEAELMLTAAKRAGREGISIGCVENASSDIPQLSANSRGGFRQTDWHMHAVIGELKVDYMLLNKITHAVRTDVIIQSFYNPIYGGLAGGAEGTAVITVAGMILMQMAYMTTMHSQCPTHPFFMSNTTPEILWVIGMSCQALTRNTPFILDVLTSPKGGPCTKTVLYEATAVAATATVSGAARLMGVRSTVGKFQGHATGLEARYNGEVAVAVAGMSRGQINEIVSQVVPKYVDLLDQEPKGKRFDEAYNMHTLRPTPEWDTMYREVKEEIAGLGIPFN
jgi:methylamine--corrinoid protein Co-methyltransferase